MGILASITGLTAEDVQSKLPVEADVAVQKTTDESVIPVQTTGTLKSFDMPSDVEGSDLSVLGGLCSPSTLERSVLLQDLQEIGAQSPKAVSAGRHPAAPLKPVSIVPAQERRNEETTPEATSQSENDDSEDQLRRRFRMRPQNVVRHGWSTDRLIKWAKHKPTLQLHQIWRKVMGDADPTDQQLYDFSRAVDLIRKTHEIAIHAARLKLRELF